MSRPRPVACRDGVVFVSRGPALGPMATERGMSGRLTARPYVLDGSDRGRVDPVLLESAVAS
jgi:hypothetical protein